MLEQLRRGDASAARHFVEACYPGIFRYLLSLTGRREVAEDLTQETFLQAWRQLHRFEPRAPLRHWLYRIAYRQFLMAARRRRPEVSLEESGEVAAREDGVWAETAALHAALDRLPAGERDVMLLHYLEGYTSAEIAAIVRAPAGTVRYRLSRARARLQQELGDDDLAYLNETALPMRQWQWLPLEQMRALEERLALGGNPGKEVSTMKRREFLHQAAAGAAGLMLAGTEKEIVDGRLAQKVTLAFKGTALSDLCDHLRAATGVHLSAGASVTDEKVTIFCAGVSLRDVMRQLSRPFGYAWTRSARDAQRSMLDAQRSPASRSEPSIEHRASSIQYRYELVQDLRSQLLEEELRGRDRNAALLALDREMQRYRPYLGLSPEEAEARARTATPQEQPLLQNLAHYGWGPIQIYFRLSADDMAALRAGQTLVFSAAPRPGERALPPGIARGILEGLRNWRVARDGESFFLFCSQQDQEGREVPPRVPEELVDVAPPAARPQVRVRVDLSIEASELGHFAFRGGPSLFTTADYPLQREAPRGFDFPGPDGPWAAATSPSVLQPKNQALQARLASHPTLQARVTVRPEPSCRLEPYPGRLHYPREARNPRGIRTPARGEGPRVTSADVLEALHLTTGLPIVSDFYTCLYAPDTVSVQDTTLFDALNTLGDALRLRWVLDRGDGWLRFRSTSFYDDRVKEVPNRLLSRWSAARRQHSFLRLEELVEIAGLTDTQLDAGSMAEGARACFGLVEWELARHPVLRPHLRYLAGFTPEQREEALSATGLPLTKMPLAQQQGFLTQAIRPNGPPLASLGELEGATLWIEYTQPGGFQWVPGYPGPWQTWLMPVGPGRRAIRPPIRERTREAVLQKLAQVDPKLRSAIWESRRRDDSGFTPPTSDAAEVYPTTLDLILIYVPGTGHKHPVAIYSAGLVSCQWTE